MLSPEQESSLTSVGDCFEHWHSSDRVIDHQTVLALHAASPVYSVSDDFTVTINQDFIAADTTLKNITITLPLANNGREIEIMKNAKPNYLSIVTVGVDKILGVIELRVYNYGTSLRFKAITNGWVII